MWDQNPLLFQQMFLGQALRRRESSAVTHQEMRPHESHLVGIVLRVGVEHIINIH